MESSAKNIPRHEQISAWLKNRIDAGVFNSDDKLPSEFELSRKFSVSRVTVRRALQTLEQNQLIYRCQGIGSFVKNTRTESEMIRLTDFMEDMRQTGKTARSEVLNVSQEHASEDVATRLGVKAGQIVLKLERLRLGNEEPVAYDLTWLPLFYGQLIADHDLADKTIFKIFEEEYEIPILRGTYRIHACVADAVQSDYLKIQKGAPLLIFDRMSYTINDKAVYYQRRYYRADKVSWQVSLERNPDSNTRELPLKEFVPVFS
ncbi:MAG: GntR family transcriptional regulator [Balneolales bacterium]|nr:GntR family transcriptional regulator [Balneolales bacterium]